MKKITLLLIMLGTMLSCFAQTRLGFRAGYNFTTITRIADFGLDDDRYTDFDWKSSVNFGVVVDLRKSQKFVFRPGIYYSCKGFKIDDEVFPKTNLNYLEMPLLAVFQQPIKDKIILEIQVGPYFAYGIGGKYEYEENIVKNNKGEFVGVYTKYKSFKDEDVIQPYKRFDCGINAGLGINYNHFYLGASYEIGSYQVQYRATNHCFSLNVGYNF